MREIVLDTETTGLNPQSGDRVIEIGCVETVHKVRGKGFYHQYINPERDIPADATRVHGITDDFVADKPLFADVVDDFLEFIGDDMLVIHNAGFDMGFLNMELKRCGRKELPMSRATDTVKIARKLFPGSRVNLDALCKRFDISLEAREKHGALLDSELLADVYLHLCGGPQTALFAEAAEEGDNEDGAAFRAKDAAKRSGYKTSRIIVKPTEEELARHKEFIASCVAT